MLCEEQLLRSSPREGRSLKIRAKEGVCLLWGRAGIFGGYMERINSKYAFLLLSQMLKNTKKHRQTKLVTYTLGSSQGKNIDGLTAYTDVYSHEPVTVLWLWAVC